MNSNVLLEDDKLVRIAVQLLLKKLGPIETQRFLSLPTAKRLDSVKRHAQWQRNLKKKEFFDKVFG
jgi:hypothetical protein